MTDGRGVDVIYDPVGGPYTEPALRSIAWQGVFWSSGLPRATFRRYRSISYC